MRYIITIVFLLMTLTASAQSPTTNTLNRSTDVTVMTGCEAAVNSTSAENMFPVEGCFTPAAANAEGNVMNTVSFPMTANALNCYLTVAGGTKTVAGGTNYVVAFRDNATDSALTCTIGAAASACTDLAHNVPVAAGDEIDFSATPSGTPTALEAHCSVHMTY